MSTPRDDEEALRKALCEALDADIVSLDPVAGGDIGDARVAVLASGRRTFVKTRSAAPDGLFRAEAAGLAWLAQSGAVQIPA